MAVQVVDFVSAFFCVYVQVCVDFCLTSCSQESHTLPGPREGPSNACKISLRVQHTYMTESETDREKCERERERGERERAAASSD